jgi:hypothetical protein
MTDSGYRHVVLVIDRSGSMREYAKAPVAALASTGTPAWNPGPTKADLANEGLAEFFATQRQNPLRTTASLYQFDTEHELMANFLPVDDPLFSRYVLLPRGGTALLDAVGFAITGTGEYLAAAPEGKRPCEVSFVVVTDGHENMSQEYKLPQIREMITHQSEVYDWRFIYLGAEPGSFDDGVKMGFSAGSTSSYGAGQTRVAYASAGMSLNTATADLAAPVFTETDRKAMNDDDDAEN